LTKVRDCFSPAQSPNNKYILQQNGPSVNPKGANLLKK
jgi:hypothetical protein